MTVRDGLQGAVVSAVCIPLQFWLRFRDVGPLGWGMTVFFVVFCLLSAVAVYFRPRTEFHTQVALRGGWIDRVGAFWLVACASGPFLGWLVTEVAPLTDGSWRGWYALRVALAAGLPILTALPLTRYARGPAALVALPLLAIVTLLPVGTAVASAQDLRDGPMIRVAGDPPQRQVLLRHTGRSLPPSRRPDP